MIGVGLLEAIPVRVDRRRRSRRRGWRRDLGPAIVWSREFDQPMLGVGTGSRAADGCEAQSAAAFSNDMGISSPMRPDAGATVPRRRPPAAPRRWGRAPARPRSTERASTPSPSMPQPTAVPPRRDPAAPRCWGQTGLLCGRLPAATSRPSSPPARRPMNRSFQLIWPYTDMLLHDMGPDLADGRPEARATGPSGAPRRSPGASGLTEAVSGERALLHDGRARRRSKPCSGTAARPPRATGWSPRLRTGPPFWPFWSL